MLTSTCGDLMLAMYPMECGCIQSLISDADRLVVSAVNVGGDGWWCECADVEDPVVCWHAKALLDALGRLS